LRTRLFVKVYLYQETAKGPFRFLSQAAPVTTSRTTHR